MKSEVVRDTECRAVSEAEVSLTIANKLIGCGELTVPVIRFEAEPFDEKAIQVGVMLKSVENAAKMSPSPPFSVSSESWRSQIYTENSMKSKNQRIYDKETERYCQVAGTDVARKLVSM